MIDAAQALGHIDCAVGADAIYSSSRKWLAGPRGVGVLAIRPGLAQRLRPRLPPPEWDLPLTVMERLEHGEANVAARVGLSVALGEHLAAGPPQIRGAAGRAGPTDPRRAGRRPRAGGWSSPSRSRPRSPRWPPIDGADPQKVRAWLIAERGIVTTYAEVQRAPFELRAPVLRVSPHVDSTAEDLATFAEALAPTRLTALGVTVAAFIGGTTNRAMEARERGEDASARLTPGSVSRKGTAGRTPLAAVRRGACPGRRWQG